MEISQEKYEKLLLKAQKFDMLSKLIDNRADNYLALKYEDLQMLQTVFCREKGVENDEA